MNGTRTETGHGLRLRTEEGHTWIIPGLTLARTRGTGTCAASPSSPSLSPSYSPVRTILNILSIMF